MNVVRHDDELAQFVAFTRKIPKRILHHFTNFGSGQCTFTVTSVEPIVDSARKANCIFSFLSVGQWIMVRLSPDAFFLPQSVQFTNWQGISLTEGNKIGDPVLPPMWQSSSIFCKVFLGIEEFHNDCESIR